MFTGLIRHTAVVESCTGFSRSRKLRLRFPEAVPWEPKTGDSVSCNGICLTITTQEQSSFDVYASPETLSLTTLDLWTKGQTIHIEPALKIGDNCDGHYVFGHVDGVAEIVEITDLSESRQFRLRPPETLIPFLAPKGSVAVDGVSLTITNCSDTTFDVVLIPHTISLTQLGQRKINDIVNIEVDPIARYVVHALNRTK